MKDRKIKKTSDTLDILHHVGLINSVLEDSAACYEKLGFTLTPLSIPRITLEPGRTPEPIGAGNRHAIFTNNYLELLGVVDLGRWDVVTKEQRGPYDLDAPLSRYEGLHVMHLGTDHIEDVKERLDKQGIECSAIKEFQRNVQTEKGDDTMRAKTIAFPSKSNPEGLIQVAQHDTPELIFQDRYVHHPNGATALTDILIVTETPDTYASKYAHYTGHQASVISKNHIVIDLGSSKITIVNPKVLDMIIPDYVVPVLPFMAAFTVEVTDLQLIRNILAEGNIPFTKKSDCLIVYPENACGCAVVFETSKQL